MGNDDQPVVPEGDLGDWLPGVWAVEAVPAKRSRRHRRGRTVEAAALAVAPESEAGVRTEQGEHELEREPALEPVPAPVIFRSPRRRRERRRAAADVARIETPGLRRRARRAPPRPSRTATAALVIGMLAGCAVLPWAAPEVPKLLAGLVPDQSAAAPQVKDPSVEPPRDGFTGPVGVTQEAGAYAGVRLQSAGQPEEVRVPRLHVDSPVVPISGQSGTLLPPSDPQQLGWWQEGKPVGAQHGTAVITGHTVHTGGGALDHLDKLVVGDSLRVRTDAGWIRYVVQRARIYSTDELALDAEKIFRFGGPGRLVLITCDDWNGEFYEANALVIATPVADEPFAD